MTEITAMRIKKAASDIEKINKKIERIEIALNGGKNPYYYSESDMRRAKAELSEATARLEKWNAKAIVENTEEKELRVEAIEAFLENWKREATEYYTSEMARLNEYLKSHREKEEAFREECHSSGIPTWGKSFSEKEKELGIDYDSHKKYLKNHFSSLILDIRNYGKEWESRLETILEREKNSKRRTLIMRVKKVVGEIKDATGLYVAANLEINGIVIGVKGTATVTTIRAGGWNVQQLHFRVLVNAI